MQLNVNSPAYYTNEFGVDDEIYWLNQGVYEYFLDKEYSEIIHTIGIVPIVAPKEVLDKGLWKSGKRCEPKAGFASIGRNIDYEVYVSGDMEQKKVLMMQCILDSVKSIKTKGKIDFARFEEDFTAFCKQNNVEL